MSGISSGLSLSCIQFWLIYFNLMASPPFSLVSHGRLFETEASFAIHCHRNTSIDKFRQGEEK